MIAALPKKDEAITPIWRLSFPKSLPSTPTLLLGIFILLLISSLYFAQTILIPLTLAFFLYMVLHPIARGLQRLHVPKMLGAILIVLSVVGVATVASLQLVGPAQDWISNAPARINKIEVKIKNLLQPVEEVRKAAEEIGKIGQQDRNKREVNITDHSFTDRLFSSTQTLVGHAVIIIILLFFLLASGDNLWEGPSRWSSTKIEYKAFMQIVHDIERRLSNYLFTVTLINATMGAIIGLGMFFIGLPNPFLWGVMAGFLNFIPYLGPLIGEIVVGMVALFAFNEVGHAILAPLFYFAFTFIEGNFITPMILGKHFTISPLAIVLSMIFWGWIWGIIGLFLAIPLLMLFTILHENLSAPIVHEPILADDNKEHSIPMQS